MRICKRCGAELPHSRIGLLCLICDRLRKREWRLANPEKSRAASRYQAWRYRTLYREERNTVRRRQYKPEVNTRRKRRRLDWLATGDVTSEQLKALYRQFDGKCAYCGRPAVKKPRFNPRNPTGFDHITPHPLGGKHTITNMTVCCGPCNANKGLLGVGEWLKKQSLL